VRSTDHGAPHYEAFSTPLLPRPSYSTRYWTVNTGLGTYAQRRDFGCQDPPKFRQSCTAIIWELRKSQQTHDNGTLFRQWEKATQFDCRC
jgi:hypothetical protein